MFYGHEPDFGAICHHTGLIIEFIENKSNGLGGNIWEKANGYHPKL